MKQIGAAQFKQKCLAILDGLSPDGLVITKHGRPVAKLIPIQSTSADLIGRFKGKLKLKGNLRSTGARWNAES